MNKNDTDLISLQTLVVNLNDQFQSALIESFGDRDGIVSYIPFTITAGQTWGNPLIEFMGVYLWGGDDDPRQWIEETNDYEDLHDFLITQATRVLKELNTGMVPLMIQTNDVSPTLPEDQPKDDELNF